MTKEEFVKVIEELQENCTTVRKNGEFSQVYFTNKDSAFLCDNMSTISQEMKTSFQEMYGFGDYGGNFSFTTDTSKQSITEKITSLELFKLSVLESKSYIRFKWKTNEEN